MDVGQVLMLTGGMLLIAGAIGILWYVFSALGYYTMAKNYDLPNAWISWIPICQYYILGELIGNKVWGIDGAKWILVVCNIISTILGYVLRYQTEGFIVTFAGIFALVYYVYLQTANYKLYQIYCPNRATLYLILGIIFPFLVPVWTFIIRKNARHPLPVK